MKELGKTAAKIIADIRDFRANLGPSDAEVIYVIDAAESRLKPMLNEGAGHGPDFTQMLIRSAIVALVGLEAEVSYFVADRQAGIRSKTELAFEHLQRSIVVDENVKDRWFEAFKSGEVACEKLGAVHLLSHGIWAFKANAEGGRTDLVYQEPMVNIVTVERSAEGMILTEWKKYEGGSNPTQLAAAARAQVKAYSSGVFGGIELKRTRYIIVVSQDNITLPRDLVENEVTYRHINLAVCPRTPSKLS
jgi:hypothetical protein